MGNECVEVTGGCCEWELEMRGCTIFVTSGEGGYEETLFC